MGFKQLVNDIEGFFHSVIRVPNGMVLHTHNMVDSNNGIVASESSVFVPCSYDEYCAFVLEHSDQHPDGDLEVEPSNSEINRELSTREDELLYEPR